MDRADRRRRKEIEREITITHRIERVGSRRIETKGLRRHVTVDREGCTSKRRSPKRRGIHTRAGIAHAAQIAAEHLDVGHHVMAPCHRLRGLQMGETRHHPIRTRLRLRQQRADQRL